MERALKERIIGATVLVVFVVLVVPVFLDGPPDEPETVSERVPLPGQTEQGESRTVVLARDRDQPVPTVAEQPDPVPREVADKQPASPSEGPSKAPGARPAESQQPKEAIPDDVGDVVRRIQAIAS